MQIMHQWNDYVVSVWQQFGHICPCKATGLLLHNCDWLKCGSICVWWTKYCLNTSWALNLIKTTVNPPNVTCNYNTAIITSKLIHWFNLFYFIFLENVLLPFPAWNFNSHLLCTSEINTSKNPISCVITAATTHTHKKKSTEH